MSNSKKAKNNSYRKQVLVGVAREGWYKVNKKIARQRDIVFLILLGSIIGNILQVVL